MDDKIRKEAQLVLSRAKIWMFERHPFYAHILTHLQFEFVDELPMGMVSGTDGKRILIQPAKYLAMSKPEQPAVLGHELMHCLAKHIWRTGARDPFYSNVAQDIEIYHVLKAEGFAVLQANEVALQAIIEKRMGPQFGLDDFLSQFWEQIYDAIAPPQQEGGGNGNQSQDASREGGQDQSAGQGGDKQGHDGACGHCYQPQPANSPESKAAQEDWKGWIREAGMYAKMAGSQPGYWSELVKAATPEVPFETRFFEYLKRSLGGDQTFDSFNRRYLHLGIYMPSEVVEQMGETILVSDTSGSRSGDDLAYTYGVFRAWRGQHPCRVHVVDVDYKVAAWRTFEEYDELPESWEANGRGGTSFAPPFVEAKKRHIEPALLIYITDGYSWDDYAPEPSYPVLWVLTGLASPDFKPPYGDVVRVPDRE